MTDLLACGCPVGRRHSKSNFGEASKVAGQMRAKQEGQKRP